MTKSPRTLLCALGTVLYFGSNVAAAPLDIDLDICLPFGIEVGLFIDLFDPPQVTEVVPFFATSTTAIPSAGTYTVPAGISATTVIAQQATELCVTSVTTKTTTYPCSTSTSFPTTWWDPCKSSSTSGTCQWTPPATSTPTTVTTTVTTTLTESATPCPATTTSTSTSTSTPTPTLSCDPYGYLVQYASLYRVDLSTGTTTEIASGLGQNTSINAMGYNTLDNYLYAYQSSTKTILRISADGTTVTVDTDAPPAGSYVGDIDTNGHYWVGVGAASSWAKIDLAPGSPTYGKTLAHGTATSPGYDVADWVYIPNAGEYLYAVGSIASKSETALLRFSMSTHKWETVANYGKLGVVGVGAAYGMNNGTLYASENGNGQIWQFPISGGTPFMVSQGPPSGNNDGARCVLNLLSH
ncbi:hypothetical protein BGW36DRAFT_165246 [Talaromyces proteolyticus]|uniref:DUF6923 domain-containing protein n=1 Tax=Talaromyces proteolyticus TaxID=1131652 RepID=A0AAD4PY31_9EURO|nr:uncharacterized protein BGW36DRAFT_165246 [Talaromyces proteolyticus]KAH8697304.1 hypothetical protein BGW36DRAFT_165246 [Talaromyces proteolyticus]